MQKTMKKAAQRAAFAGTVKKLGWESSSFAVHGHGDVHRHIGVQGHCDRVITHGFEWAIGHADLRLEHGEALPGQLSGNIVVGHRTKQTTVNASLLGQLDCGTAELFTLSLRLGQFGSSDLFKFSALDFKFLDGRCRGATGAARRDQEIACVTVFDFDDFTQVA